MATPTHNTATDQRDKPYRLTDALDALNDSVNMLALIRDLLCCARDGEVTLSQKGASGLVEMLRISHETSFAACKAARADIEDNYGSERRAAMEMISREYRRGYQEGLAAANSGAHSPVRHAPPVPDLTEDLPEEEPGGGSMRA